jgi:predicted nucleic acid-binding protein
MILVDTSVLIDFLKGKETEKTKKLDHAIAHAIPFGICSLVYQEVLQGARTDEEFCCLSEYLRTQTFHELKNGLQSYENAARMYMLCRKNGITLRGTIDLIIAEIAIENDLFLLHDDADYTRLAGLVKSLKVY